MGRHPASTTSLGAVTLTAIKRLLLALATVFGTIALINEFIARRVPHQQNELDGELRLYPWRHGDLAYVVRGAGPPLLLVHGLGVGNSMAEWKENVAALSERYTVYALDLLGWGLSARPRAAGKAAEYVDQLAHFLEDVINAPCVIIASSQSCAYAIVAAARLPQRVEKLVLVCPSIEGEAGASGNSGARPEGWRETLFKALELPVIGTAVYNLFASRRGIRRFAARHLFFDKQRVDDALVNGYYNAAHQRGAQHGVLAFLTGLSSLDARAAWSRLEIPALLVWGRHAMLNGLETAPEWLALKQDAQLRVIDEAMLLPHVERPTQFNRVVLDWLVSD